MNRYEFKTVYGDGVQAYFTVDAESIDQGYVLAVHLSTRQTGARPDIASIEFVQVLAFDVYRRKQEARA